MKGGNTKMSKPKKNDNPDRNRNGNPPNDSRNSVSSKQIKCGRRRKYPKPGEEGCRYIVLNDIPRTNQHQNPVTGSDALVPPGFEAVFENRKRQKDNRGNNDIPSTNQQQNPIGGNDPLDVPSEFEAVFEEGKRQRDEENNKDSNVIKVGQTFTAIIEGEFDSGFWLSVRSGNSSPALRGLLFKPESHVSTVIPDDNNNAAVGVPLVPRSVIPLFPIVIAHRVQNIGNEEEQCARNNTNETPKRNNESPSDLDIKLTEGVANSCKSSRATLEKYIMPCVAPEQTTDPLLAACKAMSVVLKPVNLSTGVPLSLRASPQKGKGISKDHRNQDPFLPKNSPSPALRITPPSPGRGMSIPSKVSKDIRRNQAFASSLLSKQRDPNYQSSVTVVDGTITGEATMLMRPPALVFDFDRLVIEVLKRIRAHSDFLDIANDDKNSGVKGSNSEQEPKVIDVEESNAPLPHSPSSSRPSKVTRLMQDKKNGEPDQN